MTILSVENICKSYNQKVGVENLSFTLSKGLVLGILGPNSAGKTTSIECILGTRKASIRSFEDIFIITMPLLYN